MFWQCCWKQNEIDETIYPVFDYNNKPIVKKKILHNIKWWGAFPNKCIETTFDDWTKDRTTITTYFYTTPQLKYPTKYIIRKSEPEKIMEVLERLNNWYIVNIDWEFVYVPRYDDLLSLWNNRDYKHPDLSPTNPND